MILGNSFCDQSGVLYVFMVVKYFITIVKTVAPIILIYGAMKSLFKVVGKPDEFKQVVPSTAKKLVAALAIFLVPTIVNYAINGLAEADNSSFASCSTNANIEYIKSLKDKEEQERKDRVKNRESEAEKGADEQADRNLEDYEDTDNIHDYHKKKQEERERQGLYNQDGNNGSVSNSVSNSGSSSGSNGTSGSSYSGGTDASYGDADSNKRARKTVTINGRTYDQYIQTDFTDVAFDGETIATAGCSAVSFVQAASGWDRDITIWDGASMVKERTFSGIMGALDQKGIPYSGPLIYNSNDNNQARIDEILEKVRAHFKEGKPVIALITRDNAGNAKYCGANHFITIYGEDSEGNAIIGNSKVGDKGDLEEIIKYYMPGGGKGFLLVG